MLDRPLRENRSVIPEVADELGFRHRFDSGWPMPHFESRYPIIFVGMRYRLLPAMM
jgi:hypothetical protein